jgi:hypothetical protein
VSRCTIKPCTCQTISEARGCVIEQLAAKLVLSLKTHRPHLSKEQIATLDALLEAMSKP